ncbi:hypothetical protein ABTX77_22760 [Streptomyces sp. NPDC097704]|uniref:hypothetical protein n=1 Tax=Streptomyces sp. NPDC097704 TaxID=3157101 RepID=UPI0033195E7A
MGTTAETTPLRAVAPVRTPSPTPTPTPKRSRVGVGRGDGELGESHDEGHKSPYGKAAARPPSA